MAKSAREMPESSSHMLRNVAPSHLMSVSEEKSAAKGPLNWKKVFPKIGVNQWSNTLIGRFLSKSPEFGKVISVVNGFWGKQGKGGSHAEEATVALTAHEAIPGGKAPAGDDICVVADSYETDCLFGDENGRARLRENLNKEEMSRASDIVDEEETPGSVASLEDEWERVAKEKGARLKDTSKPRSAGVEMSQTTLKVQGTRTSRRGKGRLNDPLKQKMVHKFMKDHDIGVFAIIETRSFLPPSLSDHSPTLLRFGDKENSGPKPFKFFHFWAEHPEYMELVGRVWSEFQEGDPMVVLYKKLRSLERHLRDFNITKFGNVHSRVAELHTKLDRVQASLLESDGVSIDIIKKEMDLRIQLLEAIDKEAIDKEEKLLKQKSIVAWLKDGDQNTAFFHRAVKERNARATIRVLYSTSRDKLEGVQEIKAEAVNFYQGLLGSQDARVRVSAAQLSHILKRKVSHSKSQSLMSPITEEEIKAALFSMGNDKSPGLNGFMHYFSTGELRREVSGDSDRGILYPLIYLSLPWRSSQIFWILRQLKVELVFTQDMNPEKSKIFMGGISEESICELVPCSGFKRGTLPVRYLGLPLVSGKLSAKNYPFFGEASSSIQAEGKSIRKLNASQKLKLVLASKISLCGTRLNTKDRLLNWKIPLATIECFIGCVLDSLTALLTPV
ncbi:hypothetical protein CRG98_012319 [Punica granatum]|uniref:Reverse transcriptase domain-containing protein n=1 Tax=Punica granatum TaxID=22663 RepID=A0A2I0KFN1_PUNGR|nr:hypothetical protein CRG98_012319 [Punica granatum]